jgi:hypothetical protein
MSLQQTLSVSHDQKFFSLKRQRKNENMTLFMRKIFFLSYLFTCSVSGKMKIQKGTMRFSIRKMIAKNDFFYEKNPLVLYNRCGRINEPLRISSISHSICDVDT